MLLLSSYGHSPSCLFRYRNLDALPSAYSRSYVIPLLCMLTENGTYYFFGLLIITQVHLVSGGCELKSKMK